MDEMMIAGFVAVAAVSVLMVHGQGNAGETRAPETPTVLLQRAPVGVVAMPDGSYAFYNQRNPALAPALFTAEGAAVNVTPRIGFEMPPLRRYPARLLVGRDGELHEIIARRHGTGRRIAVDRFIDLWHRKTAGGKARWGEPKLVWAGYTGAMMGFRQLSSGRIVVPFGKWIPNRALASPTGAHVTTVIYSDDAGATWGQSPARLTSPCYEGYNGNNYGACEPVIQELGDSRIYMLMRTQTGFLYESWSTDGVAWAEAKASRFHASTGPPCIMRLRDGRIVIFWNNCEMPPRLDGRGVYGGRDALHAAISDDDGRTWRGFREVYRDPHRNDTPPKRGDRGTAYPSGAYTEDGSILMLSGQGRGRRNFVRIDPEWLTQTHQEDDFSDGLDGWHVFKPFGPAVHYWRDRTVGPVLADHPTKAGAKVMHIRRPDRNDADGAVWNSPLGWRGRLTLRIMLNEGFAGGSIALNDRFFEPCDDNGERLAMFSLPLHPNGRIGTGPRLDVGRWHAIELAWDLSADRCRVRLDGADALALPLAHKTGNGISYLRLRSTAEAVDHAGFLVESARADIEDPAAPPRRPEQNRAMEAMYLRLIERHRNRASGAEPPKPAKPDADRTRPADVG